MKSRLAWFIIAAMLLGPLSGLLLQPLAGLAGTGAATDSLALITAAAAAGLKERAA